MPETQCNLFKTIVMGGSRDLRAKNQAGGAVHRVTPAMQGGIADHVWSLEEIAELLK
jgi:hypothetical protein